MSIFGEEYSTYTTPSHLTPKTTKKHERTSDTRRQKSRNIPSKFHSLFHTFAHFYKQSQFPIQLLHKSFTNTNTQITVQSHSLANPLTGSSTHGLSSHIRRTHTPIHSDGETNNNNNKHTSYVSSLHTHIHKCTNTHTYTHVIVRNIRTRQKTDTEHFINEKHIIQFQLDSRNVKYWEKYILIYIFLLCLLET